MYIFVKDQDCHWYLIKENEREAFYNWIDAMENDDEIEALDFDDCRINNPSDFCFENPINCFENKGWDK